MTDDMMNGEQYDIKDEEPVQKHATKEDMQEKIDAQKESVDVYMRKLRGSIETSDHDAVHRAELHRAVDMLEEMAQDEISTIEELNGLMDYRYEGDDMRKLIACLGVQAAMLGVVKSLELLKESVDAATTAFGQKSKYATSILVAALTARISLESIQVELLRNMKRFCEEEDDEKEGE